MWYKIETNIKRYAKSLAKAAVGRAGFDIKLPNGFELVRLRDYKEEDIERKACLGGTL
ncbi:TPA: hypothetical protein HA238_02645 [Candidatus Micrarchaeota archaeon]|nr:hypothetical protein [Candidatus Micrarchaeota archaeon]